MTEKLAPFHVRASAVVEDVFGGEHHVSSLKWDERHCKFLTHCPDMSTFDFSELTRIVVSAHDNCVRVTVSNGGPNRLRIHIYDRERTSERDPLCRAHPTLERHVQAIREGGSRAMQRMYDEMRIGGYNAT